jgi:hypothetical protein
MHYLIYIVLGMFLFKKRKSNQIVRQSKILTRSDSPGKEVTKVVLEPLVTNKPIASKPLKVLDVNYKKKTKNILGGYRPPTQGYHPFVNADGISPFIRDSQAFERHYAPKIVIEVPKIKHKKVAIKKPMILSDKVNNVVNAKKLKVCR